MKNKTTNWEKVRKLFQDVHLWLGLGSGIVILLVCLSGTLYVFNNELLQFASPELYYVQSTEKTAHLPVEKLQKAVENEAGGKVASINIPADNSKTYQFYVKKEGEKSKFGTAYFVNPYDGVIQGTSADEGKMKAFMGYMFSLHRWLLLDRIETPIINGVENREIGRKITGTATILFTLGCITGLIIWFPKKMRNWKQGLKIKFSRNWKRTNHDLHNTLAFYSLLFLLIMGLTGPQWSFPWYRTGMQKALGTYEQTTKRGKKEKEKQEVKADVFPETVTLSSIMLAANDELEYSGNYRIGMPDKGRKEYSITKTKTGFFAPAAGDKLIINAANGKLISKEIFSKKPLNERIASSIKALHIGTVYGTFTKLLYFFSCLIATSLPVTGTLIWLNKLKKKRAKSRKKPKAIYSRMPTAV